MVKIIIDSSADFTQEDAKRLNLEVAPLQIIFGEEQFVDGIEITKEMFYDKLTNGKHNPKTSQPSPQTFLSLYEKAKENNEGVLVMTIASKLSGTFQSATTAKSMIDYDDIYVMDSLCVTSTLNLLVGYAVKLRDKGLSAKEIYDAILPLRTKSELRIAPNTLEYLYRGGRLSKTTKIFGNLLSIKPIIGIDDEGLVKVFGKARGEKQTIKEMIDEVKSQPLDENFPIMLAYTTESSSLGRLEEKLKEAFPNVEIEKTQIGPVVGTHVGPKSFSVSFVTK